MGSTWGSSAAPPAAFRAVDRTLACLYDNTRNTSNEWPVRSSTAVVHENGWSYGESPPLRWRPRFGLGPSLDRTDESFPRTDISKWSTLCDKNVTS
jgi:hypothetical protein